MFGMLKVVLGGDRVARGVGIARELHVFFRHVRCRAADFHIRPVRLVDPRQGILALAAIVVASPHAFVLTVSHGSPVTHPWSCSGLRPPTTSLHWFLLHV